MHRIDSQGSEVHRAKLSKLREEWLGREMANLLEPSNHRKVDKHVTFYLSIVAHYIVLQLKSQCHTWTLILGLFPILY